VAVLVSPSTLRMNLNLTVLQSDAAFMIPPSNLDATVLRLTCPIGRSTRTDNVHMSHVWVPPTRRSQTQTGHDRAGTDNGIRPLPFISAAHPAAIMLPSSPTSLSRGLGNDWGIGYMHSDHLTGIQKPGSAWNTGTVCKDLLKCSELTLWPVADLGGDDLQKTDRLTAKGPIRPQVVHFLAAYALFRSSFGIQVLFSEVKSDVELGSFHCMAHRGCNLCISAHRGALTMWGYDPFVASRLRR